MIKSIQSIQHIDLLQIDEKNFKRRYVGCLILTKNHKILLQQRGPNWKHFPEYLSEFGGQIEPNEIPIQALMRELNEELGAKVKETDVISLGAITEESTKHTELIYIYFWYDKQGTITGCYEGEAKYFDNIKAVLNYPNVMDSVCWLLRECQKKALLK